MDSSAESKIPPKETLELISKFTAVVVLLISVCGFLTISLHHSSFGFSDVSPFRPKIFSAGAWFLIFAVVPAVASIRFSLAYGAVRPIFSWQWIIGQYSYFWVSILFALFAQITIEIHDSTSGKPWFSPVIPAAIWIISKGILAVKDIEKHTQIFLLLVVLGAGGPLVWCSYQSFRSGFAYEGLLLWFFGTGVLGNLAYYDIFRSKTTGVISGIMAGAMFLTVLGSYAETIYPHIKSSWGGGSPVPVVMYFSKDSRTMSSQHLQAQLLDESDAGYYIVGQNDKKAMFIPRNAVSLAYFSDKLLDPMLVNSGVPTDDVKAIK
jgi:hypothetical protein